jgi:UDP-2,3-diacylglucosamine pyrophosphatase LpxH
VVSTNNKLVYVISDLHLGGALDPENASGRGFRIFTQSNALRDFINGLSNIGKAAEVELVINGDFVDFLAEKDPETDCWAPLKTPESAETILRSIAGDRPEGIVFAALRDFMARGGRLTLLLGNHDVELRFPKVRRALEELLACRSDRPLHFVYDGEAYVIGDVLIEHGNRYDSYNTNDYDALRRVRSLQSRREPIPHENEAQPSPGSVLVASFINQRKWDYPFIDLLKPENETVIPLLVALDPNIQDALGTVFQAATQARGRRMRRSLVPLREGDIGATEPIADDLESIVEQHVGKDGLREFQEGIGDTAFDGREDLGDIGATRIEKRPQRFRSRYSSPARDTPTTFN